MVTVARPAPDVVDSVESPPDILGGISLNELSRRTGIVRSYLTNIFSGKRVPSTRVLHRIARELNVTMDELYAYLKPLWDQEDHLWEGENPPLERKNHLWERRKQEQESNALDTA